MCTPAQIGLELGKVKEFEFLESFIEKTQNCQSPHYHRRDKVFFFRIGENSCQLGGPKAQFYYFHLIITILLGLNVLLFLAMISILVQGPWQLCRVNISTDKLSDLHAKKGSDLFFRLII